MILWQRVCNLQPRFVPISDRWVAFEDDPQRPCRSCGKTCRYSFMGHTAVRKQRLFVTFMGSKQLAAYVPPFIFHSPIAHWLMDQERFWEVHRASLLAVKRNSTRPCGPAAIVASLAALALLTRPDPLDTGLWGVIVNKCEGQPYPLFISVGGVGTALFTW